jgi:hypothetical protein
MLKPIERQIRTISIIIRPLNIRNLLPYLFKSNVEHNPAMILPPLIIKGI